MAGSARLLGARKGLLRRKAALIAGVTTLLSVAAVLTAVRLVSDARASLNYPLVVGVGLVEGLVLGVVIAYVWDRLAGRLGRTSDVEAATGLKVLGVVPAMRLDGADRAAATADYPVVGARAYGIVAAELADTVGILREHESRRQTAAEELGVEVPRTAYVFSNEPDGSLFLIPDSVSQRYERMATHLGVDTTLHKLRHYSATELINAGVDIRTVAGRLGHGGGGATTLRVYAAWLSEADQRAADHLAGRMPPRQPANAGALASTRGSVNAEATRPSGPYVEIADDLRAAIRVGALKSGDRLPTISDLCSRYKVGSGTAHRAVQLLKDEGLVEASRGRRAIVN